MTRIRCSSEPLSRRERNASQKLLGCHTLLAFELYFVDQQEPLATRNFEALGGGGDYGTGSRSMQSTHWSGVEYLEALLS
jgi:hypothetical protein